MEEDLDNAGFEEFKLSHAETPEGLISDLVMLKKK